MGHDLAELSKAKSLVEGTEGETCSGPIQGEKTGMALQLPSSGTGPQRVLELGKPETKTKGSQ